jgi:hypothetical protein
MMRVVVLERIVGQQLLMQPHAALPTQHAIELTIQPIFIIYLSQLFHMLLQYKNS